MLARTNGITRRNVYAYPKVFRYLRIMDFRKYIEIRPDKRFGKPCLKGTRISVYDVLNWMANGMTAAQIKLDFEEISDEMIQACLAFAADRERKLKVAL
ncbi:MAG: DUF433 domain-containing protein [Cryomorphaceae bacterium]